MEISWDDLKVLLAVQRGQSFLAAGKTLGVSTSTAARRLEQLEQSLGRPLVHRSSRGTTLEPEALELATLAEQIELKLSASRRDQASQDALTGTVLISVGNGFARSVTGALADFQLSHPQLSLELVVETRFSDLARREADLGIRTARSASKVLIERSLGTLRFGLFASRSYLDRRLRSGSLDGSDFGRHDFIGFTGQMEGVLQQRWLTGHGAQRFAFRSNADVATLEAAERGLGIALLAEVIGRDSTGLVQLKTDVELPSIGVWLAFHRELRTVPRVRAVATALEDAFKRTLGPR